MAKGGYDYTFDREFANPAFEPEEEDTPEHDSDETDISYNTNTNNKLADESDFEPNASVVSGVSKLGRASVVGRELQYAENEDKLIKLLKLKPGKYNEGALSKFSAALRFKDNNLFIKDEEGEWIKDVYGDRYNFRSSRSPYSFKKETTIKKEIGTAYSDYVHDFINQIKTPEETIEEETIVELLPLPPGFKTYEQRLRERQQTEETSFIENVVNKPNTIKSIIDASDEDLQAAGFTRKALRELRGLRKAGDDLAAVKAEKDRQITQLEFRVKDLDTELTLATEENIDIRERLMREKNEVEDQLILEKHKVWQINKERESNLQRIKNIITDVLKQPNSKIPLRERLKLLFKVEGITIAAILAAVIMTFSTIGLAISNSMKGKTTPTPPSPTPTPPSPSIPDRISEGLKKFAEWLKELAKKSAAALPGIIGSIVSFIFKATGAVVGFLAEHVFMLLVIVVSSIIYGLVEGVRSIKKS